MMPAYRSILGQVEGMAGLPERKIIHQFKHPLLQLEKNVALSMANSSQ